MLYNPLMLLAVYSDTLIFTLVQYCEGGDRCQDLSCSFNFLSTSGAISLQNPPRQTAMEC